MKTRGVIYGSKQSTYAGIVDGIERELRLVYLNLSPEKRRVYATTPGGSYRQALIARLAANTN